MTSLRAPIILVRDVLAHCADACVRTADWGCGARRVDGDTGRRAAGRGPAAPTPPAQGRGQTSPASQRPPQTKVPQDYPAAQIEAGRTQFASQCGFCHGRDAAGGAGGPDLTRSTLVAEDVRGDRLGPVIRSGRPAQGMPAFALSDAELAAIVAFIHDQKRQVDTASGGRRSVDATDLQTGDAAAGKRYFDAACTRCHSATGDLAGVAARHQGLTLLQRMLYPSQAGRGGDPSRVPQTVTVTLAAGQTVTGHARLSRRVHDRADRRLGVVPVLAGLTSEILRGRSSSGARRTAGKVHR